MDHRDELIERHVDLLALCVHSEADGSGLGDGAPVVRLLLSFLRVPAHVEFVGQDSCRRRRRVSLVWRGGGVWWRV